MKDAFIIDAIRTPIGSFGGSLSPVRADDLAALPIIELLKRNPSIPAEAVEDVILGCHNQAGEDNRNVARMALLLAGLPYTVPGETVNRLCSSGMSAVIHANRAIKAGDGDVFIAGGVEHMTRGPWVISKTSKPFGNDAQMFDSSFGWRFVNPKMQKMYGTDAMGVTAENLAEMYNISREDQDLFAYRSQQKAFAAQQNGILAEEIIPVEMTDRKGNVTVFEKDEFVKPSTSLEGLAKLKPAFKKEGGTVTAGNASGMGDGACALIMCSEEMAQSLGLEPLAEIVDFCFTGRDAVSMGLGPVEAVRELLAANQLKVSDIDYWELNEAFSHQVLSVIKCLGIDQTLVNRNGGGISLSHPLGMTGARIIAAASWELALNGGKLAVASLCVGGGMAGAVLIKPYTKN